MPISLVLDIIISVLLVLTIAYAVRLNQRLSQLRSDKNELLQLAKTFADATTRAEAGIQHLKISSEALQTEIEKAATLKDDLSYLVERGGRSADEMVAKVRTPMRPADPDARLIEDAIRAATPQNMGSDMGQDMDQPRTPTREDRAAVTRRIAGRQAKAGASSSGVPSGASSGRTPGTLATRGLSRGQGRDLGRDLSMIEDDDAIEDTQAARELLKALSAVK